MKSYKFFLSLLFSISLVLVFSGCSSGSGNPTTPDTTLTQANVVLNLKKGETTEADVLNAFGAPNIITTDASGNEIWSYQRNSMSAQTSGDGFYATIILAGYNSQGSSSNLSTKTSTLIIKFGQDKKVIDFKFMAMSF